MSRLATAVVVIVMVALAAGQLLGQPVLLGFVETGSMAPTMAAGDGFVAVPMALAGPVEPGDVVTYRAEAVDDGGLVTHRVVGETDRGYVTRGDANAVTDQSTGEPPVKAAQVVAVAWRPGGSVLTVPGLGTAVGGLRALLGGAQTTLARLLGTGALLGTSGIGWVVAGLSGLLYLFDVLLTGGRRPEARDDERSTARTSGFDVRLVLVGFALLLVAGATVAMVAPAGAEEYGVVSAEFDSDRQTVVRAGGEVTLTHRVHNTGILPVRVYLAESGNTTTVRPERFSLGVGAVRNASVTARAPPETGFYRGFVTEHRYLLVLPPSLLDALYAVHPWAPLLAVDAVVGVGFYLAGRAVVGRGRVAGRRYRRDDADGWLPFGD